MNLIQEITAQRDKILAAGFKPAVIFMSGPTIDTLVNEVEHTSLEPTSRLKFLNMDVRKSESLPYGIFRIYTENEPFREF